MQIDYLIIADGIDVTLAFQDRLISLTINDEAGQKSDTAEIVVDDRDYLVALPETGAKLEIALGFVGDLVEIGTYVVDELSGTMAPDILSISAKAADMAGGIKARKTRAWRDVTVADIIGKIAGEHGFEPLLSDSLKAQFYAYQAQTAESDLNFLTRLAKDLDAIAKLREPTRSRSPSKNYARNPPRDDAVLGGRKTDIRCGCDGLADNY